MELGLRLATIATQEEPGSAVPLYTLGWAQSACGKTDEAISTMSRALELAVSAQDYPYRKALARMRRGADGQPQSPEDGALGTGDSR